MDSNNEKFKPNLFNAIDFILRVCVFVRYYPVFLNARGEFLTAQIKDKENYQHKCATCEKKKDRDAI